MGVLSWAVNLHGVCAEATSVLWGAPTEAIWTHRLWVTIVLEGTPTRHRAAKGHRALRLSCLTDWRPLALLFAELWSVIERMVLHCSGAHIFPVVHIHKEDVPLKRPCAWRPEAKNPRTDDKYRD
ncbi:MAG: hypothetical protein ACJAZO_003112 [Myxococcota bacterium]|jgi:hypothetical protein